MALVIFDLDGTLVDSRQDLADSTNAVLESFGAPALPRDQVVMMVGDGARTLVQRALAASMPEAPPDLDEALLRFHAAYRDRLLSTTRPYPGASLMLADLASSHDLAMLTNKPGAPARMLVDTFGWSAHFPQVLGGDGDCPRKPDPAGLRHLMRMAGAGPEETMLVGDSMVDISTARAAGVAMCVARYGFGHARGDLALRGDEWIADTAPDVGRVVRDWVGR